MTGKLNADRVASGVVAGQPAARPDAPPAAQLCGPIELASRSLTAAQRARLGEIEDRLLGHVLRVIDLDRLYQLEQCLWSELGRSEIDDDSGELATALLATALLRVADAPERHCSTIPDGITDDEVMAVEYDDHCLMCRNEASDLEYRLSGRKCQDLHRDAEDLDLRQFMDQAAKRWRKDHAAQLRRFGLA